VSRAEYRQYARARSHVEYYAITRALARVRVSLLCTVDSRQSNVDKVEFLPRARRVAVADETGRSP